MAKSIKIVQKAENGAENNSLPKICLKTRKNQGNDGIVRKRKDKEMMELWRLVERAEKYINGGISKPH
jgi:hypothetical protein